MKKVFKRMIALSVVAAMALPLAACGNSNNAGSSAAGDTKEIKAIDNKDIKIGVSIWSSTDVLGSQCKKYLMRLQMH